MNVLCIIPARGGSKGIPRKNIKLLAGKPLIAWSIESALAADSVNRLIVSTDDEEITSVAKSWGAETIQRPSELANDTASSESSLVNVIETLEKNEGYKADLIVFLQATSPYRSASDIDGAVNLLLTGYDSVFSAYSQHFIGRWEINAKGNAYPLNFDPMNRPMRQEQPVKYIENGSIYVFKPDILQSTGARMGRRIGIYPMPEERSYQIDEPEDLKLLEKLMVDTAPAQPNTELLQQRIPPVSMLKRIKLLVMDFDGVLTDNKVWVNDKGQESVCCSRSDSWGLTLLKAAGIQSAVISTESNSVVKARCRKLDIPCISNTRDKAAALSQLSISMKVDRAEIAFIGNDTNDKDALCWAGISILVSDSEPTLASFATWILSSKGGQGAVRECCDAILKTKNETDNSQCEGEGTYFKRLSQKKASDYEEEYWGTIQDPDGMVRDRLQEQKKCFENINTELTFLNNLVGEKILDVGCGLGFLLSGLDSQWERYGVEVSNFASDHAKKFANIFQGKLEDAAYPSKHFDAIVFHHVIEHLDDPLQTLREIHRVLRPGGWLILGTPDFDSGCARLFGSQYRLLHDTTHISLFTCESMHRLLRDEGFIINKVDFPYFSTPYFTKENLIRLFDTKKISPPFYGNFMTFYTQKPNDGEFLRPSHIKITHL